MEKISIHSKITLNNGYKMPYLGLGTWQLNGVDLINAVHWAYEAGYRHFDTATYYQNEKILGDAIANYNRDEIFITTKIWPSDFRHAEKALKKSLLSLNTKYVDQYLIHWPSGSNTDLAWKSLTELYERGIIKSIGVSNYSIQQLRHLIDMSEIKPAVNQIYVSPFHYNAELIDFCKKNSIVVVAYSPLSEGRYLSHPVLGKIASQYQRTPAQIMLRWAIQHNLVIIPKSRHQSRIIENSKIFDFTINTDNMMMLDRISSN